jgi:hypothetical protein
MGIGLGDRSGGNGKTESGTRRDRDTEEGWSWQQESVDSDVCILEAREREFRCESRDIIENQMRIKGYYRESFAH